jgi:hypothetical protein
MIAGRSRVVGASLLLVGFGLAGTLAGAVATREDTVRALQSLGTWEPRVAGCRRLLALSRNPLKHAPNPRRRLL